MIPTAVTSENYTEQQHKNLKQSNQPFLASSCSLTYKQVCSMAQELGASVSAQVHSKVHAVLCNFQPQMSEKSFSMSNSLQKNNSTLSRNMISITQRMKKAIKKCIPIWDIQWLLKVHESQEWIDPELFNVTKSVKELMLEQNVSMGDVKCNVMLKKIQERLLLGQQGTD
jgi:hypothetical protein